MQAIQVKEYVNGPEDLTVTTLPAPTPRPDEYLIKIHACAMNYFDLLQIRGKYQNQPPLPWISGTEFSGTILTPPTSSPSPILPPGTPIFGSHQGAFATHICCPASSIRPVPPNFSLPSAAGLSITAPTAYAALITRAGIKAGDCVLIHAAAGGVGLAAVQVAKAFGAHVIAAAGSREKLEVAKAWGADAGVDYTSSGWEGEVKKMTPGGKGVDIVFDPVGMVEKSFKCVAWGARIVVVGFAAGSIEKVAMNRVLLKHVSLMGVYWGGMMKEERHMVEEVWRGLEELMREGKFGRAVFEGRRLVGLERVGEALGMLGRRETWGKVVVEVDGEGEVKKKSKSKSKL